MPYIIYVIVLNKQFNRVSQMEELIALSVKIDKIHAAKKETEETLEKFRDDLYKGELDIFSAKIALNNEVSGLSALNDPQKILEAKFRLIECRDNLNNAMKKQSEKQKEKCKLIELDDKYRKEYIEARDVFTVKLNALSFTSGGCVARVEDPCSTRQAN